MMEGENYNSLKDWKTQLLWFVSRSPPKPHAVVSGVFSEGAGSGVCDVGIEDGYDAEVNGVPPWVSAI